MVAPATVDGRQCFPCAMVEVVLEFLCAAVVFVVPQQGGHEQAEAEQQPGHPAQKRHFTRVGQPRRVVGDKPPGQAAKARQEWDGREGHGRYILHRTHR